MKHTEAYHLAQEAIERALSTNATTEKARDDHLMNAEHHADCAWSISEDFDLDFTPDSAENVVFLASPKLKARISSSRPGDVLRG